MQPTEVGIKSPGQALTLLSEDGLRFVCRTLSERVLASRTFGADLRRYDRYARSIEDPNAAMDGKP